MLLTPYERQRFIGWLDGNVDTCAWLTEQMKIVGGTAMDALIKKQKEKMTAYITISNELKNETIKQTKTKGKPEGIPQQTEVRKGAG